MRAGCVTDIDRFVQARLEARGLSLGPDADARTLIRRVSFDLTGLPPTPEEIEWFVSDHEPGAYERMVDRYLASPRYGERWGKHWLDAAGYADSNGYFSADTDRPLAYRYRDYVIRSLERDKPFDRFLREQLAGDEMAGFRSWPADDAGSDRTARSHALPPQRPGRHRHRRDRNPRRSRSTAARRSKRPCRSRHRRCWGSRCIVLVATITSSNRSRRKSTTSSRRSCFPAFNPQDWVNPKDRTALRLPAGRKGGVGRKRAAI